MFFALFLAGGVFWLVAYILIIRVSARDRVTGMPLVAAGINVSWDFIYAVVHPYPGGLHPAVIGWLLFDLVVLYQTIKYGPAQFSALSRPQFYAVLALVVALATPLILTMHDTFGDVWGVHAAHLDNLMFSAMFLAMLYSRGSTLGQSVAIAVAKLVGTGLISVAFFVAPPMFAGSKLLLALFVSCFVLDALYVVAVHRMGSRDEPGAENLREAEVEA